MKRVIFFLILMTVYCDRGTKGGLIKDGKKILVK